MTTIRIICEQNPAIQQPEMADSHRGCPSPCLMTPCWARVGTPGSTHDPTIISSILSPSTFHNHGLRFQSIWICFAGCSLNPMVNPHIASWCVSTATCYESPSYPGHFKGYIHSLPSFYESKMKVSYGFLSDGRTPQSSKNWPCYFWNNHGDLGIPYGLRNPSLRSQLIP